MADAWELLIAESDLDAQNHDAWQHLVSVISGAGETIIISGAVEATVEETGIDVDVVFSVDATVEISDPVAANVENVVSVAIELSKIEAGVCTS